MSDKWLLIQAILYLAIAILIPIIMASGILK